MMYMLVASISIVPRNVQRKVLEASALAIIPLSRRKVDQSQSWTSRHLSKIAVVG